MLIVLIREHLECQRPSIHLHAYYNGAQAESRRELHPAIAGPRALGFEHHAVRRLVVLEINADAAKPYIVNREVRPVRRNVRSQRDLMLFGIGFEAKHATQDRAYHHRRRPYLVRRTRRKRLVVISRKNFGEMPKRAIHAEQGI